MNNIKTYEYSCTGCGSSDLVYIKDDLPMIEIIKLVREDHDNLVIAAGRKCLLTEILLNLEPVEED